MHAYIRSLDKEVEAKNAQQEAMRNAQAEAAATAARERLVTLDVRLARLLAAIPLEVQREGLSLMSLQAQLRARGQGHHHCHVGELGEALRRIGYRRERRWRTASCGTGGFHALWYPN